MAAIIVRMTTEANAMADRIAVMEGGVLQQFGSLEELRERPANLFVATFLGEPPMNALPAVVEPGGVRLEGGGHLALPGGELPAPGRRVVLGVRPHHLRLGDGEWNARVITNRWLGDQAHLALEFAGQTIVAVAQTRVPVRQGDALDVGVAHGGTHLFDADSGAALMHGG